MESWQELLTGTVSRPDELAARWFLPQGDLARVTRLYPATVNPYFASLIRGPADPLGRQVIPDPAEASGSEERCPLDPLREEDHSPVPNLTHRYPDRVLFLVSGSCPVLCRFCTRKRKVGGGLAVTSGTLREGVRYIRENRAVRDVLLSGGDPLLLPDDELGEILARLREIPHVQILRIGTRVPGGLPQRVTPSLARLLSRFHPLYLSVHFNHPRELTAEARAACARLSDAGLPLGGQTVLLAGVNDDAGILEDLFRGLLAARVRPYYLFQMDTVRGTGHFRVPLARALALGEELRRRASGLTVPLLAVDLPRGGGKVPLTPDRVVRLDGLTFVRNLEGELIEYPDREPTDGTG